MLGLMRLRLMQQRTIKEGTRCTKTIPDIACHPNNVTLPHKQLHGVLGKTD